MTQNEGSQCVIGALVLLLTVVLMVCIPENPTDEQVAARAAYEKQEAYVKTLGPKDTLQKQASFKAWVVNKALDGKDFVDSLQKVREETK